MCTRQIGWFQKLGFCLPLEESWSTGKAYDSYREPIQDFTTEWEMQFSPTHLTNASVRSHVVVCADMSLTEVYLLLSLWNRCNFDSTLLANADYLEHAILRSSISGTWQTHNET